MVVSEDWSFLLWHSFCPETGTISQKQRCGPQHWMFKVQLEAENVCCIMSLLHILTLHTHLSQFELYHVSPSGYCSPPEKQRLADFTQYVFPFYNKLGYIENNCNLIQCI